MPVTVGTVRTIRDPRKVTLYAVAAGENERCSDCKAALSEGDEFTRVRRRGSQGYVVTVVCTSCRPITKEVPERWPTDGGSVRMRENARRTILCEGCGKSKMSTMPRVKVGKDLKEVDRKMLCNDCGPRLGYADDRPDRTRRPLGSTDAMPRL